MSLSKIDLAITTSVVWRALARQLSDSERSHIQTRLQWGEAGCWIWTGTWTGAGAMMGHSRTARLKMTSRVLFAAYHLAVPARRLSRMCGSERCVNPQHWEETRFTNSWAPYERRLLSRIDQGADCWIWTGTRLRDGYGRVNRDGRTVAAHRAVYEHLVGPIGEGLVLDHLCRNKSCVRPEHLEPVSFFENLRRGAAAISRSEHSAYSLGPKLDISENHLERFWSKVQTGGLNDCWLWTAGVNGNGYGTFTIGSRSNQRTWDAHRFAFLVLVGTPEEHLVLDHLCNVKRCVNPSHLQPVSRATNALRWLTR